MTAATEILERVDPGTRDVLVRYGFDAAQFAELQERVREGELSPRTNVVQGRIEPLRPEEIVALPEKGDPVYAEAYAAGMEALRAGRVAVAVINGGMATRFGGVVKGTVEAVDGRSFLEWKMIEVERVAGHAGAAVPFVVMNSFATDEATRAHIAEKRAADPSLPEPLYFNQFVSLRMTPEGALFIDDDGTASPYAPGHGDFSLALRSSGMINQLRERGVRLVMLSNVDNLGARPDPAVIGMHLRDGHPITTEVVAKGPHDVGGAPARVDGVPQVVEGFRFPPDFDQSRIGVFNINSFVFDLDVLDRDFPLTWFYVEKKVEGRVAIQLERLVNELTAFAPSTYLQVPREGARGRFFPIKTREDLVTAQGPLREMLDASVLHEV